MKAEDLKERTFSMYPQERTSGFPFLEHSAVEKPLRRAVVMGFGCNVMIDGWIRRRKPLLKAISELSPYKDV